MPLPVTYSTLLNWWVRFKFTDAEEVSCHSRLSASNAHILRVSPTIQFTGRHQTSKMAQCGENLNASSAANGDQKAKRKVALITGITGQVNLPSSLHPPLWLLCCAGEKLETRRFPFRSMSSSVLHLTGYNIVVAAEMRYLSTGNNNHLFIVSATEEKSTLLHVRYHAIGIFEALFWILATTVAGIIGF